STPGTRRIFDIRPQAQEPEESAQDIFAFGDPRHRFNVEGVQGEERSYESAAPKGARHLLEEEKQDQSVGQVEEEVDQVMGAGTQAEKLDVKHVGDPGQGVPIRRVRRGESPDGPLPTQT